MDPGAAPDPTTGKLKRRALAVAGWAFFGLGGVGIVVPGLPTVVFWIVAAWFWARSSPALLHRVISHPRYGATIADFLNHGVMRRRDKRAAFIGMSFGFVLCLLLLRPHWWLLAGIGALMAGGALWISRRPEVVPVVVPDPDRHDLPPQA